jgi:hypothetical protein
VVSILPPLLLARITRPNPNLKDVFAGTAAPSTRSEVHAVHDEAGVLLDWKRASSELGSMGLTYLLLALILLNKRSISDGEYGLLLTSCIIFLRPSPQRYAALVPSSTLLI